MSAISTPSRSLHPRIPKASSAYLHDVTGSVKSWGRRGILFGGTFGFVLGAIFVTIPFTSDVLAFGTFGTLLVSAIDCAVIAGGFAALGAALFADGVRGGNTAQYERILKSGHRSGADITLSEWPARWEYPARPTVQQLPRTPDQLAIAVFSLKDAQAQLNTIDAWENGNAGP